MLQVTIQIRDAMVTDRRGMDWLKWLCWILGKRRKQLPLPTLPWTNREDHINKRKKNILRRGEDTVSQYHREQKGEQKTVQKRIGRTRTGGETGRQEWYWDKQLQEVSTQSWINERGSIMCSCVGLDTFLCFILNVYLWICMIWVCLLGFISLSQIYCALCCCFESGK